MNPDRLYVTHISEAIADIEGFITPSLKAAVEAMLTALEDAPNTTTDKE
jgi:hypothetical protein